MKEETREWVDFAEQDWVVVNVLMSAADNLIPKAICFHAQQSSELYLKARLTESVIYFPKTHNLEELLDLVLPIQPDWNRLRPALVTLTDYAVITRYPGFRLTRERAEEARALCQIVRATVRTSFGLND